MHQEGIIFELIVIFSGVAVISTIFLFFKQPIIISYIILGMLAGPFGFGLIQQTEHIKHISHLGIILLLFLIGLNLHPNKLLTLFRKTALVTFSTSFIFSAIFGIVAFLFGFMVLDSMVIGAALMFSSTIVALKLTPTTTLHQKHLGELLVSVLLLQDIIAIFLILLLDGSSKSDFYIYIPFLIIKGIALVILSILVFKYLILSLFRKYDTIQEFILVLSLGWCLAIAGLSKYSGMSYEIGAFIAGISVAISPIALVIAEKLKPLREFFLILFFFAIGSQFDVEMLKQVLLPGMVLALIIIFVKPMAFFAMFRLSKENKTLSRELGFRLGQASEFSLLVAYMAIESQVISGKASYLVQLVTVLSLIFSTYLVMYKFATPIGTSKSLRAD